MSGLRGHNQNGPTNRMSNLISDILDSDVSDDRVAESFKKYAKFVIKQQTYGSCSQIHENLKWDLEHWLQVWHSDYKLEDFWIQPNYSKDKMWVAIDVWSPKKKELQKIRFRAEKSLPEFYS